MPGHKNPFRREKRPAVTVLAAASSVVLFLATWGVVWASNREVGAGDDGGLPPPTATLTAAASASPGESPGATATPTRSSRAS